MAPHTLGNAGRKVLAEPIQLPWWNRRRVQDISFVAIKAVSDPLLRKDRGGIHHQSGAKLATVFRKLNDAFDPFKRQCLDIIRYDEKYKSTVPPLCTGSESIKGNCQMVSYLGRHQEIHYRKVHQWIVHVL